MGGPPQQPSPPPQSPPASREPATAISDPFKLYEFAAKQVSESRASFERYYKITLGALLLVVGAIVSGAYFLVGHEYSQIEASLRTQANDHFNQLDQDILTRTQTKINEEFSTPAMHKMIQDVAREQTATGLKNELESIRRDLNSARSDLNLMRADLNRLAAPRVVTAAQKAALASYLSSHQRRRTSVPIRFVPGDPEAASYAAQIADAIRSGGWETQAAIDSDAASHDPYIGLYIIIEYPESYKMDLRPNQPTSESVVYEGFREAGIYINGNDSTISQHYAVYLYVGSRLLTVPVTR